MGAGLRNAPGMAMVLFALGGCSSAPSRSILGSYFPSWMICALIAMALTIVVRAGLAKAGVEVPAPIVVYLAMTMAFSFGLWLLWLG
jgi:hypothetical protein